MDEVQRASRLVKVWTFEQSGRLQENMKAVCHLPIPCPRCLFHLALPELQPFIITSDLVNKTLSSVSCSSKLIKTKERKF